jgi:hypothetical protein
LIGVLSLKGLISMQVLQFSDISMMLQNTICSADFFFSMRTKATAFTRNRTLSMRDILYFIMGSKNKALQTELDEFQEAKGGALVTRQAFSKARENIDARIFEYLNYKLIKKYETEEANVKTYKGYRLLSGDASLIDLPNTPELREIYGYSSCGNSEKTYAKARAMTIYDVLNDLTISAKLLSYNDGERTKIHTFADELKAQGWYDKSILLLDRGYPSFDLYHQLIEYGMNFVIRLDGCNQQKEFEEIKEGEAVVQVKGKRKRTVTLRVVNIKLDSGIQEKLVTNLPTVFDAQELKKLYAMRWEIETSYDKLKNKLCVEIFTGETPTAIYQDFFAGILLMNMASFALREQQDVIDEGDKEKNLKQSYQPNVKKLIYDIKTNLVALFSSTNLLSTMYYKLMSYQYIKRFAVHSSAKKSFPRYFGFHKSHCKTPF